MRIAAYVSLGVGAVGVGLGTLFLVQRSGDQGDADDLFSACEDAGNGTCTDADQQEEIESLDQSAADKGTLSVAAYAVGAAGLATGITLWLLSSDDTGSANVRPYVTGNMAGVTGRF
jgi:hypothetical protein